MVVENNFSSIYVIIKPKYAQFKYDQSDPPNPKDPKDPKES